MVFIRCSFVCPNTLANAASGTLSGPTGRRPRSPKRTAWRSTVPCDALAVVLMLRVLGHGVAGIGVMLMSCTMLMRALAACMRVRACHA